MSETTTADHRTRNRLLIVAGAVIVAVTYLYLVIGQPAEVATSSTSAMWLSGSGSR